MIYIFLLAVKNVTVLKFLKYRTLYMHITYVQGQVYA